MKTAQQRQTKYCTAIESLLPSLGHASNADLLKHLRLQFPAVSATTIHRATARLAERGVIAIAPSTKDGAIRYDATVRPHDHFMCESCGLLRDADIKEHIVPTLEQHIGDCSISGRLTISGVCKKCTKGRTE